MPKNSKGGSRHKRAKKGNALQAEKLVTREDTNLQHYAYVKKAYGNGQFGVLLVCTTADQSLGLSEKEYRGRVSGSMRKFKGRNFVRVGGLVLITMRDFQTYDDKVDIVHVYRDDGVRKLIKMGEVPCVENINGSDGAEITDSVLFTDDVDIEGENTGSDSEEKGDATATGPSDWKIDVDDI